MEALARRLKRRLAGAPAVSRSSSAFNSLPLFSSTTTTTTTTTTHTMTM